jgi:hypothetical protein
MLTTASGRFPATRRRSSDNGRLCRLLCPLAPPRAPLAPARALRLAPARASWTVNALGLGDGIDPTFADALELVLAAVLEQDP